MMNTTRLIAFFLFPSLCFSQIQINEIFADNGSCCLDNFGETEDFVEIINMGPSPINLAGYFFGDMNSGSIIPFDLPEETTISSGDVFVLWYDKDPEQGPNHIDSKLNNEGETIIIINNEGDTIVSLSYGPQQEDVSFSAFPDGSLFDTSWSFTMCPSPGQLNQECPLVEGCTSTNASNYNSYATIEDGTCVFDLVINGLLINEYSASNCNANGSLCGDYEDWIELYNNTPNSIDLLNYYLSDKITNQFKWQVPESSVIEPYSYKLIYASGLDPGLGSSAENTNFKITQTKASEYVVLSSPDGTIIDYILVEPTKLNSSMGRAQDASATWKVFSSSTPANPNSSSVGYDGYLSSPNHSYSSGFYDSDLNIELSSDATSAMVYYTLDGSEPNEESELYATISPDGNIIYESGQYINISSTTVLRSINLSLDDSMLDSFVETNTYFISEEHSVRVISIAGGESLDNLLGGNQIRPIGSFEIFDVDGQLMDKAVGEFNEHGNDSWAYDQRGFDYITRDQYGYNYAINDTLFRTKNRSSFQRLILKAAANDNYPFTWGSPAHIRDSYVHSLSQLGNLRMDERSHESCVLYVNGEYWGVYDMREKVDDYDFLDHYYDQDEGYVDFLKTWGGTWVEFGDNTTLSSWNELRDFIVDNDMSNEDNYEYVKGLFNTGSLIDYFILNSYVVCMDWLNWNTGWWRGKNPSGDKRKWRYILWDMDATFGHYTNYTGIPDTGPEAGPCDPETLDDPGGQGHVPILNSLLDNEGFFADYINRYADLSNSIFSCDFMTNHLDSLIAIIEPEMQRQIDTWGGDMATWLGNVEELRDFILQRCSETIVEGVEECYDVESLNITLIIEGVGEVSINSVDIDNSAAPWVGTYYSGVPIEISAGSSESLVNFYWEIIDGDVILEDPTSPDLFLDLFGDLTIVAHFDECYLVESESIIGPTVVEEGSIWQYTFPSQFTNTSEWSVEGGEILFNSSTENTVAIQWNYGLGQGQIVLTQYDVFGSLECQFLLVDIVDSDSQSNLEVALDDEQIIMFPNPTSGNTNVLFGSGSINAVIYDVSGKIVIEQVLVGGSGPATLKTDGIQSGLYHVVFVSGDRIYHKRLIINSLD